MLKTEDNIWMAGDRGASDDDTILPLTAPKVFKIGPYLLGYAGSMDGERIRHNFKPPLPKPGINIDKFMYTDFLIALRSFYENWWVDISKDSDFGMIICVKGRIYEHNAVDMPLTTYETDFARIFLHHIQANHMRRIDLHSIDTDFNEFRQKFSYIAAAV